VPPALTPAAETGLASPATVTAAKTTDADFAQLRFMRLLARASSFGVTGDASKYWTTVEPARGCRDEATRSSIGAATAERMDSVEAAACSKLSVRRRRS
jgi:hypothetical protein